MRTRTKYTHLVGIDEVGRGPLAGPVAVCAAMTDRQFDLMKEFPGLDDSKALTPEKREDLYARANRAVALGDLHYAVAFQEADVIDRIGITNAVQQALNQCLRMLCPVRGATHVYLDGLLHAPDDYSQETVIHGDALVPIISLASVIAKVSRDALMTDLARTYPEYGFDRHKGYGTRFHYAALAAHGLTPLHRRSFLTQWTGNGVG